MASETSPTTPPVDPTPPPTAHLPAAPAPVGPAPVRPAPVGWVIAAMILFWPTGIPALLASHRAAVAVGASDTGTAARESANAKRWGVISVIVGAVLVLLSILASIAWTVIAVVAVHEHRFGNDWEDRGPRSSNELPFGGSDRSGQLPQRPGSNG